MAKDYEVGFCKPPPDGQFKKGQSGNPKGRPKGSKNLRTLFNEEMDESVTVQTSDGRKRKIPYRQANIKKLKQKAMKDDTAIAANLKIMEMDMKLNPENSKPPEDPDACKGGVLLIPHAGCKTEEEFDAIFGDLEYEPLKPDDPLLKDD